MAGFALIFDSQASPEASVFAAFLESVTNYKCLEKPVQWATGSQCLAAKLDSSCSRHRGIVLDEATGSWLLAVGTVIDTTDIHHDLDLRLMLEGYLERGVEVFARLDGHFALALYDRPAEKIVIVSDPLGVISVFYGQRGSQFFVSTSALAVARAVQSRPSEPGVRYFLIRGTVLGEMTLWQAVKRMLPANALTLTRDGLQTFTYWTFSPDQTIARLSLDESVDCVIDVLSRTMRCGLAQEGKVWLSLTGGFDSRVLAAVAHYGHTPFKAYCHGQPDSRDVRIASLLSQKMGWDYEYIPLPEDWGRQRPGWFRQTLGRSDGHLDVVKTSRIVREQTLKAQRYDVSLWGFGGETFRGYLWKQEFFSTGRTSKVHYDRLLEYRLFSRIEWPILKDTPAWINETRAALKSQLIKVGEQNSDWPNTLKLDLIGNYLEHSWSGAHISSVLGLQSIVAPFDFRTGVACVLSVNWRWRSHGRLFRSILERINPVLAEAETTDGGPALPMRLTNLYKFAPYWFGQGQELIWRLGRKFLRKDLWRKRDPGKTGAAWPAAQWRRDTLSELDETILTPTEMRSAGLYDRDSLQTFLAQQGSDDFGFEELLGRVITVEMAFRSVDTSC